MSLGRIKQISLLLFFLVLTILANGQPDRRFTYNLGGNPESNVVHVSDNSILINYTLSELNLASLKNETGSFYRLSIPGHTRTSTPGKPEIPVLSRLIRIPEGETYKIVITNVKSTRINPGVKQIEGLLFPAQEGQTKEPQVQKPRFLIDKAVYASKDFLRSDTVSIVPLGRIRGNDLATLTISPINYNPGKNVLEIITSMTIEIRFSGQTSKGALKTESLLFSDILDKGILNYGPEDLITGYSDKPVRMVILTDTAFKKQLQPLIKWKTQKGYKIDILYRGAAFAGDNYTAIKNSLATLYNAATEANPAPDYLLIVGDVNRIPYYGNGQVTDMYYGEFDGNGDFLPELFTGRLPVADTSELKAVLNKILQYEKFEFADSNKFHHNALMTTGEDGTYGTYLNGQVKYAVTNYLTPDNNINEYHFYYPTNMTLQKDSVIKIVNNGVSFVNYSGHGDAYGWLHLNINSGVINDTTSFKNKNKYPFVISNACNTAEYNIQNSFGNRMLVSKDKGAIGFIGCSNSSYWDEDYYWAVGLGTPSADPTYQTTGLGAMDRLFHTHGEIPSDWYITLGQVNYAGNLAVSASSSRYIKYYWETYTVLGDPSMIPIIGTPDTFKVVLPDTLPNNITSYSLITDPFSYVAVSHFDTLWDASYTSPSGSVTLQLPGLSDDSCLIVITGQNRIPIIKTIYFSDINTEYVNLTGSVIDDALENGNGQVDFGETVFLDLILDNLGQADATNLSVKILTSSEWVTINSDSAFVGTLAGNTRLILQDKLSLTVAANVPDKGICTLELKIKDDAIEKHYFIDIETHAPKLAILSWSVRDTQTGNGDFIADPGETLELIFNIENLGSSSTSGDFRITSGDAGMTILDSSVKSGTLQLGEVVEIPVNVKLSEEVLTGSTINFSAELNCAPFIITKNFNFRVGQIRESFESAGFKIFPWFNISTKPWTISTTGAYDGNITARSGVIPHSASSSLVIRAYYPQADSLKFYYKVSSELNYDYLVFKLNDAEVFKKSGETQWEKKAVIVPAGYNKMEWIYRKDSGIERGLDCAWLDMIDFTSAGSVRYIRKDLTPARLVTPVQKDDSGKETVTVKVLNLGVDTIKGFYLAFSINKGVPVKQFFSNTLLPFSDSLTVSFTARADLSKFGIYDFILYGVDNNDDFPVNDTISKRFEHTAADEPILVYPNPFTSDLNILINSGANGKARITLTNQLGRKVYDLEKDIIKGENTFTISNRDLAASIYYLRIEFPGVIKVLPVIKARD